MVQCVVYVGNMGLGEVSCCQGKQKRGEVGGSSPECEVGGGGARHVTSQGVHFSKGCITPIMR